MVEPTPPPGDSDKELYRALRRLPLAELWAVHVPAFEAAEGAQRRRLASVVRALGVLGAESGEPDQIARARAWMHQRLQDPFEKIRRYAIAAIPKLRPGPEEETALLARLADPAAQSDQQALIEALEKIGTRTSLEALARSPARARQKILANVVRSEAPGRLLGDALCSLNPQPVVHLHTRLGLEAIAAAELRESARCRPLFRIEAVRPGLVVLAPRRPWKLDDLLALRCCSNFGFLLGRTTSTETHRVPEELAALLAAPRTLELLQTLTLGPLRYRLEFADEGHRRGAVQEVAARVFARQPELLNDPRGALWTAAIRRQPSGYTLEMQPRWRPDPRFTWRVREIPAASHPPLAAALARIGCARKPRSAWDPFCGSGLELIECGLLGVPELHGTDLDPVSIDAARANFEAAGLAPLAVRLAAGDFAAYPQLCPSLAGRLELILTNPPLGRRVPVSDLRGLLQRLFRIANEALASGGRLVLPNPLRFASPPAGLRLVSRQRVDLAVGFYPLETWEKT